MKIRPGISNQLNLSAIKMYQDLTIEKLESALDEILNIVEEKKNLPPYGYVGEGLYHIGNGCYCNKKGFDEFENSFYNAIRIISKPECNASIKIPEIGARSLSKLEIKRIKNEFKSSNSMDKL